MANGWTGNILRVNLTTGNITLEDSSKFKSFVGGMGFGYKIMYDEVPPGTKPFDEAGNDSNLLIVFYVQIMPDDLVMQLHR
ncbi:aldehyde ferredoxin oxidoreductase N-terminal domain-containing protein, partial [Escherichia coli]|uniref:aldehyde ferredoxin oxidoreductase N-terminal domain-containing protein n=1 Tax=Escherichia coli TaxID=562 RepID=UPI001FCF1C91